ncbi:MAG: hypothetical protein JRE14_00710 [Deltaproteobacteria bacterium]|nr:hypothetical protein [Deltaproteobacteria bacterium]MBW2632651.1 hypothetical protein [Deltaproteobacteria bacterium]
MKKELQSVKKDLNALAKRVDKLVADLKKSEAAKPKTKAAPKKATPKKAVKKAVAKKAAPKKAAPRKPATKKVTAADTVLKVISGLKNGTDTAGLLKKTGFNQKKVANIIFKLKKQGKIISPNKGLYVKA